MEKLQNAELLQERTSDGMSQEEQQKNQSFAASLTTKVTKSTMPRAGRTDADLNARYWTTSKSQ
jgi:hypothetical protein